MTMANSGMTLLDLVSKADQGADAEFLREGLKLLAPELMKAEVSQLVGAGLRERTETRLTYRNGYRDRTGTPGSAPSSSTFPSSVPGPIFRSAGAPAAPGAGVALSGTRGLHPGPTTRDVDALAEALGLKRISTDQVSRICKELDAMSTLSGTEPSMTSIPI